VLLRDDCCWVEQPPIRQCGIVQLQLRCLGGQPGTPPPWRVGYSSVRTSQPTDGALL
jgi:hypothetical protein